VRPAQSAAESTRKERTVIFDQLEIGEDDCDEVIPLVLCRSKSGPYDDEAFLSGWRLGEIDATLARPGISALADSIRPHERVQADLVAMARGYAMTIDSTADAEWLAVTFSRIGDNG
jgi:hypothetical protein